MSTALLLGGVLPGRAEEEAPSELPKALIFTSADMRTREIFSHAGFKLTPFQPLGETGFVLQGIISSGQQQYRSRDASIGSVQKQSLAAGLIGGYQFASDGVFLVLMAGPEWSHRRVAPIEADANRGSRFGARLQADLWLRPSSETLFAFTAIAGTASRSLWLRLGIGQRITDDVYVGPELALSSEFGESSGRLGLHVTGFEWRGIWTVASGGIALTDNGKTGPYGSLAMVKRF